MPDSADYIADPATLRTNAWCGEAASAPRDPTFERWGTSGPRPSPPQTLAPAAVDPGDWRNVGIGWGVVLPDTGAPPGDKARALDAPPCVRELLARRGNAPVFRYVAGLPPGKLRRYATDGTWSDPGTSGPRGMAANAIPRFLLLIGSPAEIPWSVQYRLQLDGCVGRLDLDPVGLERYIEALLAEWSGATVVRGTPVVWAVDHGPQDITRLMRRTIADRLATSFRTDVGAEFTMDGGVLNDADATSAGLISALATRTPAFIATSSHGATFPLAAPETMRAQLGLPVDCDRTVLPMPTLTDDWSPHGAIWYAHACCSAGCDAPSAFRGVAPDGSSLMRTLTALEALQARTAPLPQRLLGGPGPARAFVGHVEPTFDWTLRDPVNGQTTTAHIIEAFYDQLHIATRPPIGLALQAYYRAVGGLWRDASQARESMNALVPGAADTLRRLRLIASDLESMVLLGDPTVTIG